MKNLVLRRMVWVSVMAIFSCKLYAVDGVVLIDQNRALAGGVTPGDAPGFPVTISQSGSYRLSGNLTVSDPNIDVIEITTDNVTIDLNGFSIIGPTVCSGRFVTCTPLGSGAGVHSTGNGHRGITVKNGTVQGMGQIGVFLLAGDSSDAQVRNVHAISNGIAGMVVSGIVTGCTSDGNGGVGITVREGGTASNNAANFNGSLGFAMVCPSLAVGNTAVGNVSIAFNTTGSGCVLVNNLGR